MKQITVTGTYKVGVNRFQDIYIYVKPAGGGGGKGGKEQAATTPDKGTGGTFTGKVEVDAGTYDVEVILHVTNQQNADVYYFSAIKKNQKVTAQ